MKTRNWLAGLFKRGGRPGAQAGPKAESLRPSETEDLGIPYAANGVVPSFAESFRLLAQSIDHMARSGQLKRILVMGAYPKDGRTTVVANLGHALSRRNHRVVLVDADSLHPDLGHRLRQATSRGTAAKHESMPQLHLHRGKDLPRAVVARVSGMDVVASVAGNQGHIDTDALGRLLEFIDNHADYVILDSPPCLQQADAFQLAQLVDGVVYVVRRRSQNVDAQRRIQSHLDRLGANVLGVVYNDS